MRIRTLLIFIPAIAVATLAVALVNGRGTEARQDPPPTARTEEVAQAGANPTRVFECFRLDVNSDQYGADPKAVVRLVTDNFGGKLVRVRKLIAMCELALKYAPAAGVSDPPPPTDADTRIYACYQIQRGQDPNDPFVLFTQNFQNDLVQVRTSQVMCEEASKTRTNANGEVTTVGKPAGNIWQCFNLDKGKQINQKFRLSTNNFGRDDTLIIRGTQLCEDAMKLRLNADGTVVTSGKATGRVLECFRLESKLDPRAKVTLETNNFGRVDVTVRRAFQMCEPGEKTPVYIWPTDPTLEPPDEE